MKDNNHDGFGDPGDTRVASASAIAKIIIGGIISGEALDQHFGFEAQEITSFIHAGTALPGRDAARIAIALAFRLPTIIGWLISSLRRGQRQPRGGGVRGIYVRSSKSYSAFFPP